MKYKPGVLALKDMHGPLIFISNSSFYKNTYKQSKGKVWQKS